MGRKAEINKLLASEGTDIERAFADTWRMLGFPPMSRNVRFSKKRRFELDFYHEPSRTAIEINGGIWQGKSGHSSGTGIVRDYEKLLLAHEHGIALVYVPPNWLTKRRITICCERIYALICRRMDR